MAQDFTPLFPQVSGALAGARPTTAPGAQPPPQNQAFEPVARPPAAAAPAQTPPAHANHGKPVITVDKEGDVITHIRVQCPCGQITELKCAY